MVTGIGLVLLLAAIGVLVHQYYLHGDLFELHDIHACVTVCRCYLGLKQPAAPCYMYFSHEWIAILLLLAAVIMAIQYYMYKPTIKLVIEEKAKAVRWGIHMDGLASVARSLLYVATFLVAAASFTLFPTSVELSCNTVL